MLTLTVGCGESHGARGQSPGDARARDGEQGDAQVPDDASSEDASEDGNATDAGLLDVDVLPEPPEPVWDATVPAEALGKTYMETVYSVVRPSGLATAFELLTSDTGDTRLLVNDLRAGDAGAEVRYGAGSLYPAPTGLIWQMPRVSRTFRVAPALDNASALVSEPFPYTLEAVVPGPANASFRLSIQAERAIWTAVFSADREQITDGTLYGVVSRAEAEGRPLALGAACYLICQNPLTICAGAGVNTLAGLLDCTSTKPDVDSDANGENDAYQLVISFKSQRVDFAASGL